MRKTHIPLKQQIQQIDNPKSKKSQLSPKRLKLSMGTNRSLRFEWLNYHPGQG